MTGALRVLVPYYLASSLLWMAFRLLGLLQHLPFMQPLIEVTFKKIATIELRKEDYWEGLFGSQMLKTHQDMLMLELQKEAKRGKQAPNPALSSLDGSVRFRLLDFARGSRPLVVNFGSSTCPVFMARLREFDSVVQQFRAVADFVTVYIKEAHPTDEWRLQNNKDICQHTNLDERCKAAQGLIDSGALRTPLLVDTMSNEANKAFGALPIRLYIIQDGIVQYAGGIGPTFYKVEEVKTWLEGNTSVTDANNNDIDLKCFHSERHRA